jgi:putative transposase
MFNWVKRGLYKTKSGNFINADVNAALNIILKVIPDAFRIRDIGLVDSPRVLLVA